MAASSLNGSWSDSGPIDTQGGSVNLAGSDWTNSASIDTQGGSVSLAGSDWTNSGSIDTQGGSVSLAGSDWTNSGSIDTQGGSVSLAGSEDQLGLPSSPQRRVAFPERLDGPTRAPSPLKVGTWTSNGAGSLSAGWSITGSGFADINERHDRRPLARPP